MILNQDMFRGFSVRGVVDRDLNSETMTLIGQGIGTWFINNSGGSTIVVGHDVRKSSPELHRSLIKGLLQAGITVYDIGLTPTPLLNFATDLYQASGGVMLTASHNPSEYNGLKIRSDRTIYGDDLQDIFAIIQNKNFVQGIGQHKKVDPLEPYLEAVSTGVNLQKQLHVVVDGGNGANGLIVPNLLRSLGCQVDEIFCDPDGDFPNRDPDPTAPDATRHLADDVLRLGANLGLAFDGDGDRVILVDETGQTIYGDVVLMLLARETLKSQKAKIVYEVLCSQAVADDIEAHGGQAIAAPSGYAFVHEKMLESGAILGGELSGHMFILDDNFRFDDAILASVRLVNLVANQELPLSETVAGLPRYFASREIRLSCDDRLKGQIVDEMGNVFVDKYPVDRIDGVRILFSDGWAIVRQSNTQPVVSLRFETKTSLERLQAIANEVLEALQHQFVDHGINFPLDISNLKDYL